MDLSDDIAIGQVVKSRAGRDKGKVFLVLEVIDNQSVLIVDGSLKSLTTQNRKS